MDIIKEELQIMIANLVRHHVRHAMMKQQITALLVHKITISIIINVFSIHALLNFTKILWIIFVLHALDAWLAPILRQIVYHVIEWYLSFYTTIIVYQLVIAHLELMVIFMTIHARLAVSHVLGVLVQEIRTAQLVQTLII